VTRLTTLGQPRGRGVALHGAAHRMVGHLFNQDSRRKPTAALRCRRVNHPEDLRALWIETIRIDSRHHSSSRIGPVDITYWAIPLGGSSRLISADLRVLHPD
jgi:hypothetical protein